MSEFLKSKKANCKNCHRCIRQCPVKSIRFSAGQANVVGDECILCGQCYVVCPQNAKEIASEVEKVKVMLMGDQPVIASVAPSFVANYPGVGIGELERALKGLGFAMAEETAIGATIVKREYERLLAEEKRDVVISSCCHSVNLLIQKYYPKALPYLADVLSPMQAHCANIKERHPQAKTVFIGPCLAKKDEAAHCDGNVDGVLTFQELTQWLAEADIALEQSIDAQVESRARLFPTTGGVLKTMTCDQPDYTYLALDGVDHCMAALEDIIQGNLHHCFVEMSACVGSCINGPGMSREGHTPIRGYMAVADYAGTADFTVAQPQSQTLRKPMHAMGRTVTMPTKREIEGVLAQMGKTQPEDMLNCGSCGYNTCWDKAIAVSQGKADLFMCLPFLKERAETMSNKIINNTPDGIIVLNETLEVQHINKAALSMLNLRSASAVLGDQVVRILDPIDFIRVRDSGQGIRGERTYLAEYNRYVERTILYDRDYHILMCLLHDVTEEEQERVRKEKVSRQTVEVTDRVVEKQMRIVQEIASLLGETAAETKIALTKLKESISDE